MAESTPGRPFGSSVDDLVKVEADMKVRRDQINSFLGDNEKVVTMTTYPLIGCEDLTMPALQVGPEDENPLSRSIFFHDDACSTSPSYRTWYINMLERKGSKIVGNVPVYKDKNTRLPFGEIFARKEGRDASKEGHIYLDNTWIEYSSCCLQTTVQLANLVQESVRPARGDFASSVGHERFQPFCSRLCLGRGHHVDDDGAVQRRSDARRNKNGDELALGLGGDVLELRPPQAQRRSCFVRPKSIRFSRLARRWRGCVEARRPSLGERPCAGSR